MVPVALAPPASDEVDPARTAARQSPPTTSRRRIPIPVPPMPQSSLTLLLLGIHIKHASKRNELGRDPRHVALSDALLPNEATTQLHAYYTGPAGRQPVVAGHSRFARRGNACSNE